MKDYVKCVDVLAEPSQDNVEFNRLKDHYMAINLMMPPCEIKRQSKLKYKSKDISFRDVEAYVAQGWQVQGSGYLTFIIRFPTGEVWDE